MMLCMPIAGTAIAQTLPSADVPTPFARPFAPSASRESPINLVTPQQRPSTQDRIITSSVPRAGNPANVSGTLKAALDALDSKNGARTVAMKNNMAKGSLDRQILAWVIATSSADGITSADIAAAAGELQNWPAMGAIRNNSERALAKERLPAPQVIAAFGNSRPQTSEGMTTLARAYKASGNLAKARQLLAPWWADARLSQAEEQSILREFSDTLTREDHLARLIRSLYKGRMPSAAALAGPAQAQSLYQAYLAVSNNSKDAAQKVNAVDKSWHSHPSYLFIKARYLRRAERFNEAADIMIKAPKDAKTLVDPDAWWIERRVLSRELLDINNPKLAYRVAAAHAAESPIMAADAEFHAGWYALRSLNDPKTAAKHFAKIADISSGAISASRAYYWLGRSAEAGAGGNANNYYQRAAHYGTTFYGQLAAAKLGQSTLQLPYPRPSDADRANFANRPAVQAIKRLEAAGYGKRAEALYRNLSQEITSVGELAILAVMAEQNNNHYLALRIGKTAASRGLDVGALSHPLGAIPNHANISGSGKALAYAIARQESEFNTSAVSSAGALGLLQLLPGTAKGVATRAGLAFTQARLTNDSAYNATLGAHYLSEQLERFNGSYILTFAGYNAGPNRANQWINQYGDPRGRSIEEVVDWIERIPYHETRSYVHRVMENYEV
ncbi:transglycosylase SLT domain-containing protein, partial [Brucellaceae bacterium C25G]